MALVKYSVVVSVVLITALVFLLFHGRDQKMKLNEIDEMTELQKDEQMELFKQKDEKTGLSSSLFTQKDKMMELFRQKDVTLIDDVLKLDPNNLTETEAMYKFYTLIAFPLQGVCRVMKHIGGHWFVMAGVPAQQVDGDYFVCMDDILVDVDKPCLFYSFGVANEWSFEDIMDFAGCEIHAHDPFNDLPAKRGKNIHFYKLGLGVKTEPDMETLVNIFEKNGHSDIKIDYLKIDIEGGELIILPELIASGALDNVNQLAMELHLTKLHDGPRFIWLLEILQQLYKINFRVISHKVNAIAGPGHDQLYNYVEVVFMKDNVWN